jgi:hypothetical protein
MKAVDSARHFGPVLNAIAMSKDDDVQMSALSFYNIDKAFFTISGAAVTLALTGGDTVQLAMMADKELLNSLVFTDIGPTTVYELLVKRHAHELERGLTLRD